MYLKELHVKSAREVQVDKPHSIVFQLRLFRYSQPDLCFGPVRFRKMCCPQKIIAWAAIFILTFVEDTPCKRLHLS